MRTLQEIFNIGYLGLKSQGFSRATRHETGDTSECMYRSHNKKCLIGHCIADEDYDQSLEGKTIDFPEVLAAAKCNPDDYKVLRDFQRCHDRANSPNDVEKRLKQFALDNNLQVSE